MHLARAMGRETVLALLALALFFFNFAHAVPATAYDAALTPYLVSAGAGPDDCLGDGTDGADHAPCHACRIGEGAVLPPAPGGALLARRISARVGHKRRRVPFARGRTPGTHLPRGPPCD